MPYTEEQLMADMRALMEHRRRKVINSLMFNNDTWCFSTQQYADAQRRMYPTDSGMLKSKDRDAIWSGDYGIKLSRRHLEECNLVREVSPDVWTWR